MSGPSRALSAAVRSSPASPLAVRAIQKIIHVTKPTAMIESVPPMNSWASNVRVEGPKVSRAPKPSETTMAAAIPHHIARISRVRPMRPR